MGRRVCFPNSLSSTTESSGLGDFPSSRSSASSRENTRATWHSRETPARFLLIKISRHSRLWVAPRLYAEAVTGPDQQWLGMSSLSFVAIIGGYFFGMNTVIGPLLEAILSLVLVSST